MSNKIWVLTYTIGTNKGRKSRRLICDTKAQAEMQQRVMGGEVVEYIRQPESFQVNWHEKIDIDEELEKEKQSIAELESRTVTVKQGEVLVTVAGFTGCCKSAIAGEIEIAMKAIGLPVTWANGDSEKRMTGADWITAIEMYKPTVRIVEVNIPRAAGIKVEAE